MKELTLTITNETGLHSRPADLFVRTAKLYESSIEVTKGEKKANAKTIIKVILLNVCQNDPITLTAEGPDEEAALADLRGLVESGFTKVNPRVEI
ncbi:MAG: HPr family phosphocarrier protein [Spirochaetales bacterium]|jgi:phosphotransferase system HPr (HPr) family protein|nr:HPr family phosphocarrier protein [Spirochaetales bacterium]